MTTGHVRPADLLLTEEDYRRLVAPAISRMTVDRQLARLALMVGADEKTLRQAREARASLSGSKLFNLLTVDPTALDELLAHFGLKAVPLEAADACETRLLAETAGLVAAHARAFADGRIDHREEQALAAIARPVTQEWAGRIARADRKRA
jgi:hypothetical protein